MVDLRVATLTGPETTLQEAAIEEFNKSLGWRPDITGRNRL